METTNTSEVTGNEQDRSYQDFYPLDFNGYVAVARPAQRVSVRELKEGDILLLDGYISRVTSVRSIWTGPLGIGEIYHITGSLNLVRFPHELITVLR